MDSRRGPDVRALRSDITTLEIDAVVNAANEALAAGGGVCGAIFDAAGPGLAAACAACAPCPTGEAVATDAFGLPARWIIHAVGPRWHGGGEGEAELLASAYRRSLAVAEELGATGIAFPAVSTGIFGFPPDPAADIAVQAVREHRSTSVRTVMLVAFDQPTLDRYLARL